MEARFEGTVKWFSADKGYGFIACDGRKKDVFVHYSGIDGTGFRSLRQGDVVQFRVVQGPKGEQAEDVVVLQPAPREDA